MSNCCRIYRQFCQLPADEAHGDTCHGVMYLYFKHGKGLVCPTCKTHTTMDYLKWLDVHHDHLRPFTTESKQKIVTRLNAEADEEMASFIVLPKRKRPARDYVNALATLPEVIPTPLVSVNLADAVKETEVAIRSIEENLRDAAASAGFSINPLDDFIELTDEQVRQSLYLTPDSSIEKTVEQPMDKTVDETTAKTVEETVKTTEETIQQPIDKTVDETVEKKRKRKHNERNGGRTRDDSVFMVPDLAPKNIIRPIYERHEENKFSNTKKKAMLAEIMKTSEKIQPIKTFETSVINELPTSINERDHKLDLIIEGNSKIEVQQKEFMARMETQQKELLEKLETELTTVKEQLESANRKIARLIKAYNRPWTIQKTDLLE